MMRKLRASLPLALTVAIALAACAPRTAPPAAPGPPRFPDFVIPEAPAGIAAAPELVAQHEAAWQLLQAGNLRAAERQFAGVLKEEPAFYPSAAGLGYVALARKNYKEAVTQFGRAVDANEQYVPALVGRGEALLRSGDRVGALANFEAAVALDPGRTALRERVEALRFRGLQDDITAARNAAGAGRLTEAREIYRRAIGASPDSPFLHRELAEVEFRGGNAAEALALAQKAAALDPNEPRSFMILGEIYEAQSEFARAAEAYASAAALEPDDALSRKIQELQDRAALASLPEEYKTIEAATKVTRAQLAALIGVHLDPLLKRASRRQTSVVMTDTRSNWAAPYILSVTRAGIMSAYPNHTFQPNAIVRRADVASAASRALTLIAAEKPRLAATWRNPHRRFPDLPPGHLSYKAAALAVEAGVMTPMPDGTFQLGRPATGAEAMAAVRKLRELAETDSQ